MRALFSPGTLVIVSGYDYFAIVGDKKWWVVKSKKSKDGRSITSGMRDY